MGHRLRHTLSELGQGRVESFFLFILFTRVATLPPGRFDHGATALQPCSEHGRDCSGCHSARAAFVSGQCVICAVPRFSPPGKKMGESRTAIKGRSDDQSQKSLPVTSGMGPATGLATGAFLCCITPSTHFQRKGCAVHTHTRALRHLRLLRAGMLG